jgi:type IV secretion system protein VirB10
MNEGENQDDKLKTSSKDTASEVPNEGSKKEVTSETVSSSDVPDNSAVETVAADDRVNDTEQSAWTSNIESPAVGVKNNESSADVEEPQAISATKPLGDSGNSGDSSTPKEPQDAVIEQEANTEKASDNTKFSEVAASSSSRTVIIAGFLVLLSVGGYFGFKTVFFTKSTQYVQKSDEQLQTRKEEILKQAKPINTQEEQTVVKAPPKVPEAPPVQIPQAPEPPPPPVPAAPQTPLFPSAPGSGGLSSGLGQKSSISGAPPGAVFGASPASVSSGSSGSFADKEDSEYTKKMEARRKASIMVLGGSGGSGSSSDKKGDSKDKKDDDKDKKDSKTDKSGYLGFGEGSLGETSLKKTQATQVKATYIGKLDTMIAQGKIIEAVLETAINSDLPGTLRAIVSHDVYAENGKVVLISKGSRVVGSYESQVKAGQTRINVAWSRLIRPDGIDLAIDSPGVDPLGRSGIPGFVDDKFLVKMGNAFLVSYIVPLAANRLVRTKGNASTPVQQTTTNNAITSTSSTTTSSDFKTQQLQESSDKFRDIATKAIEDTMNTKATIYIDQGYQFNIFVNKDLVFPPEVAYSNMKMVQ